MPVRAVAADLLYAILVRVPMSDRQRPRCISSVMRCASRIAQSPDAPVVQRAATVAHHIATRSALRARERYPMRPDPTTTGQF
jgi:hypothetical protein